ncbi:MAG: DASS family sodium-coupled anion symporter [Sandaracinus sp.]|nr:DASS family sodium-coupled anion symporter [Sandaracinus sp.]MCB9622176.1 DASS family sodium-coupled anion symporter [Sandaracinus sp.]
MPVVLRLTWRTPPGVLFAFAAFVVANEGWLAGPLHLSRPAEITLGIVAIAAILWISEAVPLFVTSLLVLALELTWLAPSLHERSTLFLNAFFSDVTLLFLGGFVLSAGLERTGLDRRLARAILRRAGATPTRVLLATMATTALLSMWMSNTAACALMLGLAASMLDDVPADDGFRKALLLGIAFAANLGGIATPIGSPPNAILLRYLEARDLAPSFAQWMLLALPLLAILLALVLTLLSRRFPTKLETVTLGDEALPPIGRAQVLVLSVLLLTIVGWLFGGRVGLTSGTVALLPVMAFFGTSLLRTEELRALPWDVLLLIGGGLALGAAIDQSGLATTLSSRIPTEGLSEIQILALAAILALLLSAIMSNTAAANLLAPMMLGLAGVSLAPLLVVTAFACSLAMPLPVSTPPNAMAFGFSQGPGGKGALVARDMVVPGTLVGVLGLAILVALATLWFPVILPH